MTTCLGKSCSFCLPRVPFVNCRQFMYLVISLLVLRAGYGIWLYQFLIIAYLFSFYLGWVSAFELRPSMSSASRGVEWHKAKETVRGGGLGHGVPINFWRTIPCLILLQSTSTSLWVLHARPIMSAKLPVGILPLLNLCSITNSVSSNASRRIHHYKHRIPYF